MKSKKEIVKICAAIGILGLIFLGAWFLVKMDSPRGKYHHPMQYRFEGR